MSLAVSAAPSSITTEPVTFLIPVYNERETLNELARRCRAQGAALGLRCQLLFVDDGSADGSREVLRGMAEEHSDVRVLFLRAHFGKSAALSAGFAEIESGLVVTLDSDLQDQPEELPRLLEAFHAGADLVSGRKVNRRDPVLKRINSWLFNLLASRFAGQRLYDCNSGFKLYRAELARELILDGDRHRFIMLLARWKGYHVTEVPVRHEARRHGRSKYGPLRGLSGFFDLCSIVMLEKFRHRPIHFFGGIGAALFAIGSIGCTSLLVLRVLNMGYLTNRPLFYISILFMILGVNFFTTGMLAEFQNASTPRRPQDSVGERLGQATSSSDDCR